MKEYKSIVETLEAHGVPSTQGAIMAVKECIDAEVEKRIAERMPSEEEIIRRVRNRKDYLREIGYPTQVLVKYGDAIIETIEWLRSRLTNDSQKTEGGE